MALLEWLRKNQQSPTMPTAVNPSPTPAIQAESDCCQSPVVTNTDHTASSDSSDKQRVLPPEPHQPKLNFPKRTFGKQQRGFSASWYQQYPWLHYLQEEDSVLCFYCATAVQQKMPMTGHTDQTFTEIGFSNWQKALQKFSKHEQCTSHRHACDLILSQRGDIADMLSTAHAQEKADNRRALYTILSTLRFLARQGLPLRGNYVSHDGGESSSNFMQLLQLRTEDVPVLDPWLQKSQDRFTSPMIQNELLEIMAMTVLRKIAGNIAGKQFSIMVDETTDVSNTEQLVFCLRYVDDQLITHEEFIGLHSLDSTTAQSITHTIEDILLRLSLQLENCRGQCYDGASAMAGSRSGVATTIRAKEPRALYTHCYGHALNLAVQDTVKGNPVIRDTLDTVEEMTKLIKKSPKREGLFQKLKNDIACESPGIRLLCPTRWTVRAAALTSISENYVVLRDTWSLAKEGSNDSEMRARISGVAKQMDCFTFFFGVELGRVVLNMADNLSAALQGSTVSASEGQSLMHMTVTTLQSIRSDDSFTLFWETIEKKRQECGVDEPYLPRQRKAPRRYEVGSSVPDVQSSVEGFYRQTYYEVIDHVIQAIRLRFDQDGYRTLCRLEAMLCNSEVNLSDFDDVIRLYGNDFNQDRLATQLRLLHTNLPSEIQNEKGGAKLKSIVKFLQCLSPGERRLYSMVIQVAKIILVMPATNAVSERSFSALRRLKTWLRSTMNQSRLNWCMLLHIHSDETDKLDLTAIANEFIDRNLVDSIFLESLCDLLLIVKVFPDQ